MNIIGLAGAASAGKSTVARMLVGDHGFTEVALADPIKRICRDVFAFTDEQLWGPSSKRNEPDTRFRRSDLSCLTPRHALQQLGTEWGRGCYDNVWVDLAIRTADKLLGQVVYDYNPKYGPRLNTADSLTREKCRPRGVVISDVRFVNEAEAIRAAGGKVWRILRPLVQKDVDAGIASAVWRDHASEHALDDWGDERFDMIINNEGGSLEDLRGLVKAAMEASR